MVCDEVKAKLAQANEEPLEVTIDQLTWGQWSSKTQRGHVDDYFNTDDLWASRVARVVFTGAVKTLYRTPGLARPM